jgi:hypothetical protein
MLCENATVYRYDEEDWWSATGLGGWRARGWDNPEKPRPKSDVRCLWVKPVVGLCRLNQVDPYPITYSLSNP